MTDFERFVPELDPPAGAEVSRMAAVLVSARVVQRSSWTDQVEVSEKTFAELVAAQPPEPSFAEAGVVRFRGLEPGSRSARPQKCGLCFATPGRETCRICGGTGRGGEGEEAVACTHCESGKRPCTTCDGTTVSLLVRVVYGEDTVRSVPHIFLPAIPFELREPLTKFFQARPSVPDALLLDLTEDFAAADPYRGRRGNDEIHGHRADAALAGARHYIERLERLPSVVAIEHRAFAWPFAVVSHESRVALVISDEAGAGCLVLPAPPAEQEQ